MEIKSQNNVHGTSQMLRKLVTQTRYFVKPEMHADKVTNSWLNDSESALTILVTKNNISVKFQMLTSVYVPIMRICRNL
jgi:hypothetical protein